MISALERPHSNPHPYIVGINQSKVNKIQEIKKGFTNLKECLINKKEKLQEKIAPKTQKKNIFITSDRHH